MTARRCRSRAIGARSPATRRRAAVGRRVLVRRARRWRRHRVRRGRRTTRRVDAATTALERRSAPRADIALPGAPGASHRRLPGRHAFERLYRTFIGARAVLGMALVLTPGRGQRCSACDRRLPLIGRAWPTRRWRISCGCCRACGARPTPQAMARLRSRAVAGDDRRRPAVPSRRCTCSTPAASLNYVALLVLPVLMAGVLTPRLLALATAAASR